MIPRSLPRIGLTIGLVAACCPGLVRPAAAAAPPPGAAQPADRPADKPATKTETKPVTKIDALRDEARALVLVQGVLSWYTRIVGEPAIQAETYRGHDRLL